MKRFSFILFLFAVLFIWVALSGGISLYIDYLWFHSVGHAEVFHTTLSGRFLSFLTGFLLAFSLLA